MAAMLRIRRLTQELEAERQNYERLAHVDGLTGVPNRRAYDERIRTELALARRCGRPLSLLIIDIDHFKQVNDTLGHQVGDEVLAFKGALLRDVVRRNTKEGINLVPQPPVAPVYSGCPVEGPCSMIQDAVALARITPTPFLLDNSVWKQAIEPAVQRVAQVQLAGYQTTTCAYLWMDQGAHADPSTGEPRKDQFGRAFEEGLRAIVNTARLRDMVHMAHVVDPKIKKLLLEAGAHTWQTGTTIAPPELSSTDGKPPRAQTTADDAPIRAFARDWTPPPPAPPLVGGFPGATEDGPPPATASNSRARSFAAVAAGVALAGALGWAVTRRTA